MSNSAAAGVGAMRLCQIALSVTDLRRTQRWYREVLGLEPAGGTNLFAGPLASMVQGVPRAASTCWWLVDRQDFFQIELFEFRSPLVRPLPADWRPCDIGYTMVSVSVADLERTLERAAAAGTPPLTDPLGRPGARRACVRDPEGVLIELMEDDPRAAEPRERPRPGLEAATRSVTLSVPDLGRSRRLFADVLGLDVAEGAGLHAPEHEALWGLEGAQRDSLELWADDMLVELVQYTDPPGRPWPPGYRISDQGLLNIAFGFRRARRVRGGPRALPRGGVAPKRPAAAARSLVGRLRQRRSGLQRRAAPRGALVREADGVPAARHTQARSPRGAHPGAAESRTALREGAGHRRRRGPGHRAVPVARRGRDLAGRSSTATSTGWRGWPRSWGTGWRWRSESSTSPTSRPWTRPPRELVAEHPDIDLLIACAGLDRAQSLLAFDWRQARDDFTVNSLSNLVLLSHLAPAMARRGGGHVTAIASLAGLLGMPYEAPYSGSKAALAAIAESARAELEPEGITFTAVFPGFVDTPMFRANAFKKPDPTSQSPRLRSAPASLTRSPPATPPSGSTWPP